MGEVPFHCAGLNHQLALAVCRRQTHLHASCGGVWNGIRGPFTPRASSCLVEPHALSWN